MCVSIIVIVRNESLHIKKCLDAILSQSYKNFELILIENNSTDGTLEIIESYKDERIKLFCSNKDSGYGNLRNYAIKKTTGKYIFFTDGDCTPHYDWINQGLKIFQNEDCVGVEGRTFYESESSVTVSSHYIQRIKPKGYLTCNVAYNKESLLQVGCFDSNFKHIYEDRDLGMRIKKIGKIYFESNMLVFHQKKTMSIKNLFIRSRRAGDMVYFDFKHGRSSSEYFYKNILYPNHLLIIIFPPLIFLTSRNETFKDLFFSFFKYFSFVYERIFIWRNSFKYRKFII